MKVAHGSVLWGELSLIQRVYRDRVNKIGSKSAGDGNQSGADTSSLSQAFSWASGGARRKPSSPEVEEYENFVSK